MIPATSGTKLVKLRPDMSMEERVAVGKLFLREFGEADGSKLFLAGIPLDAAYKLAEVGLVKRHADTEDAPPED